MRRPQDPIEGIVYDALKKAKVEFTLGDNTHPRLDFNLPNMVYLECKQMHSDRISEQMSRAANVIVIQGVEAAKLFANLLNKGDYSYVLSRNA